MQRTLLAPSSSKERPHFARQLWPYLLALGTLLLGWQVAAWSLPSFLLPEPIRVLGQIPQAASSGAFWETLFTSLGRLFTALAAAAALGVGMLFLGAAFPPLRSYFRALMALMQSVPPIAWFPLLLLWFGFGGLPVVIVVTLTALFPLALAGMNSLDQVEPRWLELARVLGAGRWQVVRRVYLPAAIPALLSGLEIGFGNAWRSLIAVEMLAGAARGLGGNIQLAGQLGDMVTVLIGICVIGLLTVVLHWLLLEPLKRRLLAWRYR
jgi:NitT/TauT family transport system permease protein